jgi:cytochrome c oxidase subunit 2
MISGASSFSSLVDDAFIFILIISLVFFLGITFAMIYFVIRYHHTRNKVGANIHGNFTLEVLWTVIPTLLVLGMFYYGFIGYRDMRSIPENALNITATGRMWSWAYTYENEFQTDTLFVPVERPVRMTIESADVLHSFYIPAFRIKQDAVPGMTNYMWFEATETGMFDIFCAEYCGNRHSYMLSHVKVLPGDEYDAWYAGTAEMSAAMSGGKTEGGETKVGTRGLMLYKVTGCVACHSTDGTRLVGPSFKGIYGKTDIVVTDGQEREITVDEEYIRRSITQPDADKVKGFENIPMPLQNLTDREIEEIIAYIKELK